ncbi:AAA family ATPase [Fertoebacter nigrum]|uniref:AAA family ATPase n=1 Tax=Fertoeibacter niger TaxID=2656921 RepID=A0A8X8GY16_9RHOB|nr:ATP-binding protein [Fertoeibacter niger]NUB46413.1 AAA family ATPase [Fertoeibacter niger]
MKFNPFVPNGIAYTGMFTGRYDEILTIEQALFQTRNGNPQHLLLTGERGIGKSSLLFYADLVARGEIESDGVKFNFLTVSTDLAGISSQAGLIKQVARELRSKLRQHKSLQEKAKKVWDFLSSWEVLGVKYNGREDELDSDELLDDLVSITDQLIESKEFDGVAFLLDEADSAPSSANLGEFVKVFTERLAKRGQSKLLLVLAGQSLIVNRLRESHESSLRVFQIVQMHPLEQAERELVVKRGLEIANEKNESQTDISSDALELIASLSEGYPHFVQQFSFSAFQSDRDNLIDHDDVSSGAFNENGAISQLGAKYFSKMYYSKILSSEYRKVLDYMANHGDQWVSRKDIVSNCGVSATNIDNALMALKSREIILSDDARRGFYRLPTRSFATWILAIGRADREDLFGEGG